MAFNIYEKEILKTIYSKRGPWILSEIKKETKLCFKTVRKHIDSLVEKGIIIEHKGEKKNYYEFNYKGCGYTFGEKKNAIFVCLECGAEHKVVLKNGK